VAVTTATMTVMIAAAMTAVAVDCDLFLTLFLGRYHRRLLKAAWTHARVPHCMYDYCNFTY
jgi:hypothetical protein